jgi:phosphatidylglycerophosphate synthase
MLDASIRRLAAPSLDTAARSLARTGLGADALTLAAFLIGVLSILFYAFGLYAGGLLFFVLNRFLDGLDGAVARRVGITDRGEFLDAALSWLVLAAIPFAFVLNAPLGALAASFMILGLLFVAVTELGARHILSGRRPADVVPAWFILVEKSETALIIVIMTLLPWALSVFAYLFGILCFVSGGVRIAAALVSSGSKAP